MTLSKLLNTSIQQLNISVILQKLLLSDTIHNRRLIHELTNKFSGRLFATSSTNERHSTPGTFKEVRGTGVIVLYGPGSISAGQGTSGLRAVL